MLLGEARKLSTYCPFIIMLQNHAKIPVTASFGFASHGLHSLWTFRPLSTSIFYNCLIKFVCNVIMSYFMYRRRQINGDILCFLSLPFGRSLKPCNLCRFIGSELLAPVLWMRIRMDLHSFWSAGSGSGFRRAKWPTKWRKFKWLSVWKFWSLKREPFEG